jgi:hypothetical protein
MTTYKAAPQFASLFANAPGPNIWNFLNSERTIGKMKAAAFFKHPAVEPLASDLLAEFGAEFPAEIQQDGYHQMIGHMVKQVMEADGYELVRTDVPMSKNEMFSTGACYGRKQEGGSEEKG